MYKNRSKQYMKTNYNKIKSIIHTNNINKDKIIEIKWYINK